MSRYNDRRKATAGFKGVSVDLHPEVYEALKQIAQEEQRTVTGQVRWVLQQFVNDRSTDE